MSDEDNETIIAPPIEEIMDPLEVLVRDWVNKSVKDKLDDEFEGLSVSYEDLGSLILSCFDEVQEAMMASIIPEGTTIH